MKYSYYEPRRAALQEKAKRHDALMKERYEREIADSIEKSVVYEGNFSSDASKTPGRANMRVDVIQATTEEAVSLYNGDNVCVLNFASYKRPGGGFISGAMAQEEAICHASDLFNVIGAEKFEDEYKNNIGYMNKGLYRDWAIYSPGIIFDYGDKHASCAVLTCPAPNKQRYLDFAGTSVSEYEECLKNRCKFVLDVMALHENVDTLVLGAFGCGVFGNDPLDVATVFKTLLGSGLYNFSRVIFAVPGGNKNYGVFKGVFKK